MVARSVLRLYLPQLQVYRELLYFLRLRFVCELFTVEKTAFSTPLVHPLLGQSLTNDFLLTDENLSAPPDGDDAAAVQQLAEGNRPIRSRRRRRGGNENTTGRLVLVGWLVSWQAFWLVGWLFCIDWK